MGINHKVLAARVERGYQFLREHGEALGLDLARVDLDTLSQRNTHTCVLGQAYSGPAPWYGTLYGEAMERIRAAGHLGEASEHGWTTQRGFDLVPEDPWSESPAWAWDALDALWRERIARDREAVTAQ